MNKKELTQHQRERHIQETFDFEKLAQKVKNNFLLSTLETSVILGVSKRTLEYNAEAGLIKRVKQGRKVFFKGNDVSEYLDGLSS